MQLPEVLLQIDWWSLHLPAPVALAAVALIGYMFGQRTRQKALNDGSQARRELKRAKLVAHELEQIAEMMRRDLAAHRASVARFRDRVAQLGGNSRETCWQELCAEAEEILKPTLKLATQISVAYDGIRQQTAQLMTFTEVRIDPLTGVNNRRALDETLDNMFSLFSRYKNIFSLVIVDIDHFKRLNDKQGHLYGDQVLQKFAQLLAEVVRDTDMVARYGGEEFVVILPQTTLPGASVFSERLRAAVDAELPITISGGIATAGAGDTPQTLLARADAALYSAKAAGRNIIYRHNGEETEAVEIEPHSQALRRNESPSNKPRGDKSVEEVEEEIGQVAP